MTTICCICRRVEDAGDWKSSKDCTCQGELSHGYCPACFSRVLRETRGYFEEGGSLARSGTDMPAVGATACA
jgi:hypothetical protein